MSCPVNADIDIDDGTDLSRAAMGTSSGGDSEVHESQRVYQLTGLADPVYAEASLLVHDFDIVMDINVINRTPQVILVVGTSTTSTAMLFRNSKAKLRKQRGVESSQRIELLDSDERDNFPNLQGEICCRRCGDSWSLEICIPNHFVIGLCSDRN